MESEVIKVLCDGDSAKYPGPTVTKLFKKNVTIEMAEVLFQEMEKAAAATAT